jgi:hypothetical protein
MTVCNTAVRGITASWLVETHCVQYSTLRWRALHTCSVARHDAPVAIDTCINFLLFLLLIGFLDGLALELLRLLGSATAGVAARIVRLYDMGNHHKT